MTDKRKIKAQAWFELVDQGDLKGALKSIDREIEKSPRDGLLYRERAHIHLFEGRSQKARADFDSTLALDSVIHRISHGKLCSNLEPDAIGLTYWIEGHKDLARAYWRYTTNSLMANRVAYAHQGGGIESGQLLWFGAILERCDEDIELVREFYKKRLASTRWSNCLKSWPGPLVRFFLNEIDEDQLIAAASHPNLEFREVQLCEVHFALAIRARESRKHAAYRKHLKLAASQTAATSIYDFYNVLPYFLARSEIEQLG